MFFLRNNTIIFTQIIPKGGFGVAYGQEVKAHYKLNQRSLFSTKENIASADNKVRYDRITRSGNI